MRILDPHNGIDMGVVGWIDWADAYILPGEVRIPCLLITGERCEVRMTEAVVLDEAEAPSMEAFLENKRELGNNVGVYGAA